MKIVSLMHIKKQLLFNEFVTSLIVSSASRIFLSSGSEASPFSLKFKGLCLNISLFPQLLACSMLEKNLLLYLSQLTLLSFGKSLDLDDTIDHKKLDVQYSLIKGVTFSGFPHMRVNFQKTNDLKNYSAEELLSWAHFA